jgi:hypothetical protein
MKSSGEVEVGLQVASLASGVAWSLNYCWDRGERGSLDCRHSEYMKWDTPRYGSNTS